MSLHLQVQVLLLLAIHTLGQGQECQLVSPSSIIYPSSIIMNNAAVGAACTPSPIGGQEFSTCSLPNVLADGETGPDQFRLADPASYYLWNIQEETQMLFTFPTDIQFTGMRLYFYYSDTNGTGLPRSRVFFVNNSFQVETIPTTIMEVMETYPSLPINPDFPSSSLPSETEPVNELRTAVADFTVLEPEETSTNRILLTLSTHKRFSLPLSEVKFCTAPSGTSTTEPSSSTSTSTGSEAITGIDAEIEETTGIETTTGSEATTGSTMTDGQMSHQGSIILSVLLIVLSVVFLLF